MPQHIWHPRWRIWPLSAVLAGAALLTACSLPISIDKIGDREQVFNGQDYFLATGVVDLTIKSNYLDKDGKVVPNPTLTLSVDAVKYIPDPFFHYAIKIDHNNFYDDDISVTVDEKGLLKTINSINTDRTPDIIEKIAQAPSEIFGGKTAALTAAKSTSKFDIKFSLDPTSTEDRSRLNQHLRSIAPTIKFRARPLVPVASYRSRTHPDCEVHICFRTALPFALELYTEPEEGEALVVARQIVVLPNRHVVGQIPITRAPFVKKEFKLEFTNGMLTSIHLTNPSEALAFIQIPIAVAKSIVAIPSAMWQFKTTQITADNNLLTAQQKNLDLQRQIIQTQHQLLAAQINAGS